MYRLREQVNNMYRDRNEAAFDWLSRRLSFLASGRPCHAAVRDCTYNIEASVIKITHSKH